MINDAPEEAGKGKGRGGEEYEKIVQLLLIAQSLIYNTFSYKNQMSVIFSECLVQYFISPS